MASLIPTALFMRFIKHQICTTTSLLSIFLFGPLLVSADPEAEREALKEWVRLEREISRETSEWQAEKEILEDRIALFRAEKERLQERIEEAREGRDQIESRRAEIMEKREELEAVLEIVEQPLEAYEQRLVELYPRFPAPLQEEVRKLRDRLPGEGESSDRAITERLQAVVGMLNFADKFNTGVQREVEIRTIDGRQVEVETLYFGLAGAYFADSQGRHAGVGYPGPDGWEWEETPETADSITRLISVYNGTREAVFSPVPVSIQQ